MADTTNSVPAMPSSIATAADPCLAFVAEWKAVRDQCNANPSDAFWEARVKPLEDASLSGAIPAATTMQGAVSALQWVLDINAEEGNEGCLEPQDEGLIRAAFGFLSRPMPDPFMAYMRAFQAELDVYNNGDPDEWDASGKPFPWDRLHDELANGRIAINSPAGALVALDRLRSLDCIVDGSGDTMVEAVVAYLRREADPQHASPIAVPPGIAMSTAIMRHRAASAVVDAAAAARQPFAWVEFDQADADAETRERFAALNKAFDDACGPLFVALDEVIAAPIASLADMHAKAAYLAQVMPGTNDHNGSMAALIESMSGNQPVAVADPMADAVGAYLATMEGQRACETAGNNKGADAASDRAVPMWGESFDVIVGIAAEAHRQEQALEPVVQPAGSA